MSTKHFEDRASPARPNQAERSLRCVFVYSTCVIHRLNAISEENLSNARPDADRFVLRTVYRVVRIVSIFACDFVRLDTNFEAIDEFASAVYATRL